MEAFFMSQEIIAAVVAGFLFAWVIATLAGSVVSRAIIAGKVQKIRKSEGGSASQEKAARRLSNVDVNFISLVGKGANKKSIIYKHDSDKQPDFTKTIQIISKDDEKRLVYGVVYSPDEVDAHGDTMTAVEIEKAAHKFLAKGITSNIDQDHDEQAGRGQVVESYIISKDDVRFPDQPAGSWAVVIKITDADAWEKVKKGDITGISMQGEAYVEELEKADLLNVLKKTLDNFVSSFARSKVDKSFNERIQSENLRPAVNALADELYSILWNENDEYTTEDDRMAAMQLSANQFSAHLNTLKSNQTVQMSKQEQGEKPGQGDSAPVQKSAAELLTERLDKIEKENNELKSQIEKLEKAAPGQQSQAAGGQPEKVSKGINFLNTSATAE